MRLTSRWLFVGMWCAALVMAVALVKPTIAHLALQALVIVALAIVAVAGLVALLGTVETVHPRRRHVEVAARDLPKELAVLADELRTSSQRRNALTPAVVARQLRSALQHRLWHRHGLSTTEPEDAAEIDRRLSPLAAALLRSASPEYEIPPIALAQLPALIDEVEQL